MGCEVCKQINSFGLHKPLFSFTYSRKLHMCHTLFEGRQYTESIERENQNFNI